MFQKKSISVVIPAYNEEEAIETVIKDFKKLRFIDEIIVIDNNSTDLTSKISKDLGAKAIKEKRQGYGYACIRGLKEAKTELVVIVEGDSTFDADDTKRFLKHIDKYDLVIGSRTTKGWYSKEANMCWYMRLGNYCLAKLLQSIYNTSNINDVGCTYRIIKQESLKKFVNKLRIGGSDFTPELTIKALKAGAKIKQIPIKYYERKGETKLSSNWLKSLKIGLKHLYIIIKNI